MKNGLIALFLLLSASAAAQLNRQLTETALRYFVALPYGKTTQQFLTELSADSCLVVGPDDHHGHFQASFRVNRLFPEADFASLHYGGGGNYWKNRRTGETFPVSPYQSLLQVYRVQKTKYSWSQWRGRCMSIVRDLGANANRKDLNLSGKHKIRAFTFADWDNKIPDIIVRFGEMPGSDYWYFSLELQYYPPTAE